MALPKCWSCNYVFKWKESVVYFIGNRICPNCDAKQYITMHSNWKISVLGVPLPFIPFALNLLGANWILAGIITFLAFIIYIFYAPFKLEFTRDKQPLF